MNQCVTGWKYFSNPRMFAGYGRQKGWEREQPTTDTGNGAGKNPVNKHGKNAIQVVIKFIFIRDRVTNLMDSKRVVDILKEQISNVAGAADILVNQHGRGIFEKNSLFW